MAICGLAAAALVVLGSGAAGRSTCRRSRSIAATDASPRSSPTASSSPLDGERRVLNPGAVAIDGSDIAGVDTPDAIKKQFSAAQDD